MSVSLSVITSKIDETSREYERTINLISRCRTELNRLETHKHEVEGSLKTLCGLRDEYFNEPVSDKVDEDRDASCDCSPESCTDEVDTNETDSESETKADSDKTTDN